MTKFQDGTQFATLAPTDIFRVTTGLPSSPVDGFITLQDVRKQVLQDIYARDYGVKGDNSTDDGPAIQAAINDVLARGLSSRIILPDGDVLLNTALGSNLNDQISHISTYDIFSTFVVTTDTPHKLVTGDRITFLGLGIGGLSNNKTYWANRKNSTQFAIYNTQANSITGSGTGLQPLAGSQIASIDLSSNIITFATPHGFVTGQSVTGVTTGTLPAGMIGTGTNYERFFRAIDSLTGTVHVLDTNGGEYPQSYAFNNTNIVDITDAGTGNNYLIGITAQLHPVRFKNALIFEGSGRTRLIKGPALASSAMTSFFYQNFCAFYDIQFRGLRPDMVYDTVIYAGDDGPRVLSATGTLFHHCQFYDFGDSAIRARGTTNDRNFRDATHLQGHNYNQIGTVIEDCYFYNCTQIDSNPANGYITPSTDDCTYKNNVFEYVNALKFAGHMSGQDSVKVLNNFFKYGNSPTNGGQVEIDSCFNFEVAGNMFRYVNSAIHVLTNNVPPGHLADMTGDWQNGSIHHNIHHGQYSVGGAIGSIRVNNSNYSDGYSFPLKNLYIEHNKGFDLIATSGTQSLIEILGNTVRNAFIRNNEFQNVATTYGINVSCAGDGVTSNNIHIEYNSIDDFSYAGGEPFVISPASGKLVDVYFNYNRLRATAVSANGACLFDNIVNFFHNGNDLQANGRMYGVATGWQNTTYKENTIKSDTGVMGGWLIKGGHFAGNNFNAGSIGFTDDKSSNITWENTNEMITGTPNFHELPVRTNKAVAYGVRNPWYLAAIPTTGTWEEGSFIVNTDQTNPNFMGWDCYQSGTLGTLTGVTATALNGATSVVVSSTASLAIGAYISFAGDPAGTHKISDIPTTGAGGTITIATPITADISAAAISYVPALFRIVTKPNFLLKTDVAYPLTDNDETVSFTGLTANRNATLPTAIGRFGVRKTIKKQDSSTFYIQLNTTSSQTIDGLASGIIHLGSFGDYITVESDNANWNIVAGNVSVGTFTLANIGAGIKIKEGTNATMGVVTLSGGTATINTTKVTASSRIFISGQGGGTNIGSPDVTARTTGTSFTITSSNVLDTQTVAWHIIEPAS